MCHAGRLLLVGLIALLLVPPGVAAQNRAALEAELDRIRRELQIPAMSAAVIEGGTVVWTQHFGLRPAQRTGVSYPIASLTKPLAATLAMIAITRGKLTLDTPVPLTAAASDVPAPADPPRLRHLLSHTGAGTPGTRFLYSSELFRQTERSIATAIGAPFHDALNMHLLKPLRLSNTTAGPGVTPSGGLTSTLEDLARLPIALERGTLLSREAAAAMFQPPRFEGGVASPYALGWFVQQIAGEPVRWHFGQQNDASSLLLTLPRRRLSLIVLARSDRLSAPFWLQFGDVRWSPVAVAFLSTWVRVKLDLPEARRLMLEALGAVGTGRSAPGAAMARKAAALAPALVNGADNTLLAAFARWGDPDLRAIGRNLARRLLTADPANPRTLLDLAVLNVQDKQPAEAIKLLRRVLDERQATPEIERLALELLGELGVK